MKKLPILALLAICAVGWRSEDILRRLHPVSRSSPPATVSLQDMTAAPEAKKPKGMSAQEFVELAKTDPNAYRKYLQSHVAEDERSDLDKLLNFLAHGKYE